MRQSILYTVAIGSITKFDDVAPGMLVLGGNSPPHHAPVFDPENERYWFPGNRVAERMTTARHSDFNPEGCQVVINGKVTVDIVLALWTLGNWAELGNMHGSHRFIKNMLEVSTVPLRLPADQVKERIDAHLMVYDELFTPDYGCTPTVPRPADDRVGTDGWRLTTDPRTGKCVWVIRGEGGEVSYSIHTKTHSRRFPLQALVAALDAVEPGWLVNKRGCGVSPKNSQLTPDQVFEIVDEVVKTRGPK